MKKKIYIAISIIVWIFFSNVLVNAKSDIEIKDVKYYFNNIEPFNEKIPRSGIKQEVAIRGILIKGELPTLCAKAPCSPAKVFALRDISNANLQITIYEINPLVQRLEIEKIYILQGILEKDVDFGRKIVNISNFKPQKILK